MMLLAWKFPKEGTSNEFLMWRFVVEMTKKCVCRWNIVRYLRRAKVTCGMVKNCRLSLISSGWFLSCHWLL